MPDNSPSEGIQEQPEQSEVSRLNDRVKRAEWMMIWLTGAIALFGLCTVGVGMLQWHVMRGQLGEMKSGSVDTHALAAAAAKQAEAATDMAAAAGDQVDAGNNFSDSAEEINRGVAGAVTQLQSAAKNTKAAIDNSEMAFHSEQRAWVGVQDAVTVDVSEATPWRATVNFFNSGRSPARNVQSSVMYMTSNTPIRGPSQDQIKGLTFRPAISIAPQATYHQNIGGRVAGEPYTQSQERGIQAIISDFQYIKNGSLILYYFGILKYDDVFGNPHETQFCIYLASPTTKEIGFCDAFNDLN